MSVEVTMEIQQMNVYILFISIQCLSDEDFFVIVSEGYHIIMFNTF